jgi:excisionase family DNA binding protein
MSANGRTDFQIFTVEQVAPGPLLLTVRQAATALCVGRTTVYELIGAGELEVVHIGRSTRVPVAAVEEFVDQLRSRRAPQP